MYQLFAALSNSVSQTFLVLKLYREVGEFLFPYVHVVVVAIHVCCGNAVVLPHTTVYPLYTSSGKSVVFATVLS